MPTTTFVSTTMSALKRHRGTGLLTRNDLLDIVAAILNALPNAITTTSTHTSFPAVQPATDPLGQPNTPEEE